MKRSKAQVTMFALLGIIVVIIIIVMILASSDFTALKFFLKETKHPVEYYMEECIGFQVVDAVVILSSQGGFIYEYSPNLTTTNRKLAYSIYASSNTSPSIPFMEDEIARYIEENIDKCVNNYTLKLERIGTPKVNVTIFSESVIVELNYLLRLQAGDAIYDFNSFDVRHYIPYGRMVQLRNKVVRDLLRYPNLMLLDDLYGTDFEMYINPYSGKIKIIEMINYSARLRNEPLNFSFAIYDDYQLLQTLAFQGDLPDLNVTLGSRLLYQITCNHKCNFYDNTILFEITQLNEQTGLIDYTPDMLDVGVYNITITVDDDTYTVSDNLILTVEQ